MPRVNVDGLRRLLNVSQKWSDDDLRRALALMAADVFPDDEAAVVGARAPLRRRDEPARAMTEEVTAPELARRLGVKPKAFRAWLRAEWRAGHPFLASHDLHARWLFSVAEANTLAAEFRGAHG